MGKGKVSLICPDFVWDDPAVDAIWGWHMVVLQWFVAFFIASIVVGACVFFWLILTHKYVGIRNNKNLEDDRIKKAEGRPPEPEPGI